MVAPQVCFNYHDFYHFVVVNITCHFRLEEKLIFETETEIMHVHNELIFEAEKEIMHVHNKLIFKTEKEIMHVHKELIFKIEKGIIDAYGSTTKVTAM